MLRTPEVSKILSKAVGLNRGTGVVARRGWTLSSRATRGHYKNKNEEEKRSSHEIRAIMYRIGCCLLQAMVGDVWGREN